MYYQHIDIHLMWQHWCVAEPSTLMNNYWDVWSSWPLNVPRHSNCWYIVPLLFNTQYLKVLVHRIYLWHLMSNKWAQWTFLISWGCLISKQLSLISFGLLISTPKSFCNYPSQLNPKLSSTLSKDYMISLINSLELAMINTLSTYDITTQSDLINKHWSTWDGLKYLPFFCRSPDNKFNQLRDAYLSSYIDLLSLITFPFWLL